jgi:hypothetical protein
MIAAAIVALDPVSAAYTNQVLSETVFTLVLLVSVWLWLQAVRVLSPRFAVLAGFALAAAAMIRPIALYLPLLMVPLALLLAGGRRRSRGAVALGLVLGFALPVGAWITRNDAVTGSPLFSSNSGFTLLRYTAASALAFDEHLSTRTARARLVAEADFLLGGEHNEARRDRVQRDLALRVLRSHPRGTAVTLARGGFRMMTGPGRASVRQLAFGTGSGGIAGQLALAVQVTFVALLLVGVALGVVLAYVQGNRFGLAFALCLIGYFLVLSAGPEAFARFRVPIVPYLAALAGVGWPGALARVHWWQKAALVRGDGPDGSDLCSLSARVRSRRSW